MTFADIDPLSPRKQEILDAAKKLFSDKGYVAASMRDLAKALSIKPASLYSHYTSKDEMLWEIAVRCAKEFHEYVLPMAASGGSVVERLENMLKGHLHMIIRNQNASAIFFEEWKHLEEPRRSTFLTFRNQYEQAFIDTIEEGKNQGLFRDVNPRFSMFTLLSSINWVHRWYRPNGRMSIEDIEQEFAKLLIVGIKV